MAVGQQTNPVTTGSDTDNSKITQEQTYKPAQIDTTNATPVLQKNIYEFLDDAYHGSGGFVDGRYLVPHSREMFYEARRELAFYKNYTKPVIRAMVDPIFNGEISREITVGSTTKDDGMLIHKFIEDCDNTGKPLQRYMDDAITTAIRHGVTFVVVDNFTEQPATVAEALGGRIMPYVYTKTAAQVHKWEVDKFGNLLCIMFREPDEVKMDNGIKTKEKRFSRWDDTTFGIWGQRPGTKEDYLIEERLHGLGQIPVIACYTTDRTDNTTPLVFPPFYDIAKLNHAIFNKDSEIRDQERAQGFSAFYVQSDTPGNFNIGTHNVIVIPMDTNIPPGYASPDPSILKGLMENNAELREDLLRIAGQRGIIGVQTAKSGIAMQWDFRAEEAPLKATAMKAQWLEYRIIELFQAYTSEEFEYHTEYPDDFKPVNEMDQIDLVDKALLMSMPVKAAILLKKKVFKLLTKKQDEDDVAAALDDFEAEATAGVMARDNPQPTQDNE